MNKELSIIVSFDNKYPLMNNFIEHLLKVTFEIDHEIILVSDGCNDFQTLSYIEQREKEVDNLFLYKLKEKKGYSIANNVGVKKSKGKYLLFINTDVFPQRGSIELLLNCLKKHHEIGAVQGLLLYPQNMRVQSTDHVFSDYMNHHLYNGRHSTEICVKTSAKRQALTTAFCMIPKEIFTSIGPFNEFYYNAYDGMELTLNINLNGYKCYYLAEAIAFHSTGGTRKFVEYNNEYQSKYFYSHLGLKVKNDLVHYLKEQINSIPIKNNYFVINCSFANQWHTILKLLNIPYSNFCDIDDKNTNCIDLYHNLTYLFLTDSTPLLFIVDHFNHLSQNMNWFQIRNNPDDIIIDYHGNCIRPYYWFIK